MDSRFHGHLAGGQDAITHGARHDGFVADAALAVADRIGGLALIRCLIGAALAAGAVAAFPLARRFTMSAGVAFLVAAAFLAAATPWLRVGPPVFAIALAPVLIDVAWRTLAAWRGAAFPARALDAPPRVAVAAGCVAVALLAAFPVAHAVTALAAARASGFAAAFGYDPPGFPKGAADHLRASDLRGNVAHDPRWGGYLAWRLRPKFTATETAHDAADREAAFARHGIDVVVAPREALAQFRDDEPYEVLYSDDVAVVLLRLGGPHGAENADVIKAAKKDRRRAGR